MEDERSDKEEMESEDDSVKPKLREKPKNGHTQNGFSPLNNNHRRRQWVDSEEGAPEQPGCWMWQ